MSYYEVTDLYMGVSILVECEYYQIEDGWVQFYDGDGEFVHLVIPPTNFRFRQLTAEQYQQEKEELERQKLEEGEEEDEISFEDYH